MNRASPHPDVVIRPLGPVEEFQACVPLQQGIWECDPVDVVPHNFLVSMHRNGGIVLGAFADSPAELVGFVYGFLGETPEGTWKLCSHMLGVHPDWRGKGIAEGLKRRQREIARARGIPLIAWTFDPLESGNAHFNLAKLGATASEYVRNIYGTTTSRLHTGLPTDRLHLSWWTGAPGSPERTAVPSKSPPTTPPLALGATDDPLPRPNPPREIPDADVLGIAIPTDFRTIREKDPELAAAWRAESRRGFERLFKSHYRAEGFLRGDRTGVYRLHRRAG